MPSPAVLQLLQQVAFRDTLARRARWLHCAFLATVVLAVVHLVLTRLLAVLPDRIPYLILLTIFALATMGAGLIRRMPLVAAARLCDRWSGGKDLFLTVITCGTDDGFIPLVQMAAVQTAAKLKPQCLRPWAWRRAVVIELMAGVLLLSTGMFLPVCDPFGLQVQRDRSQKTAETLNELAKDLRNQTDMLRHRAVEAPRSAAVAQELDALVQELQQAKPTEIPRNDQTLRQFQNRVGKLYEESMQKVGTQTGSRSGQTLGAGGRSLADSVEGIKQGDAAGLKRELAALAEEMRSLAQDDASTAQARREALGQRLEAWRNQLGQNGYDQSALQGALTKALAALNRSGEPGLQTPAVEAALSALELANLESESLAQVARDAEGLKQALEAARLARRLNQRGGLNGASVPGETLADYARWYSDALSKMEASSGSDAGQDQGNGRFGGSGQGQGGKAPEADVSTRTSPELATSPVQAGRMLMRWRSTEQAPVGEARQALRQAVDSVRSSLSEAMVQERVPAGYQEGIQRYFDDLAQDARHELKE